ncbi:hypothetical protein J2X72_001374 [Phyllobacterium sp. 1468]|uniref:hypothetical protein n=1 Tax=Phyllobacterium sp. 1468 TaxID=2817759 RepID=UPI0028543378|nr:hypothetical protein [Phyllobacterium sp. 1468]MDR6632590.1 hypothetical protein [Phyllobacterium sp. 1468]
MTTKPAMYWTKKEAAADFNGLLNDAKMLGPQTIFDDDCVFEVRLVRRVKPAEDVLSEPGPLADEDHDAAFGSDRTKKG